MGHNDAVVSIAFNRDDTLIISGSRDMTIKIWAWRDQIVL